MKFPTNKEEDIIYEIYSIEGEIEKLYDKKTQLEKDLENMKNGEFKPGDLIIRTADGNNDLPKGSVWEFEKYYNGNINYLSIKGHRYLIASSNFRKIETEDDDPCAYRIGDRVEIIHKSPWISSKRDIIGKVGVVTYIDDDDASDHFGHYRLKMEDSTIEIWKHSFCLEKVEREYQCGDCFRVDFDSLGPVINMIVQTDADTEWGMVSLEDGARLNSRYNNTPRLMISEDQVKDYIGDHPYEYLGRIVLDSILFKKKEEEE